MKKLQSMLAMACFVFLAILIVFAGNAVAKEKTGKQTLKIKIASNGFLMGSFAKDGRMIYFEAIRGEENPKEDPDAPKFAVDIVIMDANGIPFVVCSGGGGLIDSQWYNEQEIGENIYPSDDEDRLFDFYLLPDLAKALKTFQKKSKKNTPEMTELINRANSFNEEEFFDESSLETIPERSLSAASSTYYKYKAEIRKKKLDNYGKIFDHSALRVKIFTSGGTLKYTFLSSNHGTWADSSLMSTKCTKEWTRSNISLPIYNEMCDTLTSKGEGPGQHSCNDDTELQYKTAVKGSFSASTAWSICSFPAGFAPNCN